MAIYGLLIPWRARVLSNTASIEKGVLFHLSGIQKDREFYRFKYMKGKGNLPFRSVKRLKRANSRFWFWKSLIFKIQ